MSEHLRDEILKEHERCLTEGCGPTCLQMLRYADYLAGMEEAARIATDSILDHDGTTQGLRKAVASAIRETMGK